MFVFNSFKLWKIPSWLKIFCSCNENVGWKIHSEMGSPCFSSGTISDHCPVTPAGNFQSRKFQKTFILRTLCLTVGMYCSEERLRYCWESNSWLSFLNHGFVFLSLSQVHSGASQNLLSLLCQDKVINKFQPEKFISLCCKRSVIKIGARTRWLFLCILLGFCKHGIDFTDDIYLSCLRKKKKGRPRTGAEYGSVVELPSDSDPLGSISEL